MIGAIIGDVVGSRFERFSGKENIAKPPYNFELYTEKCRFTDDSVATAAIALAMLEIRQFAGCTQSGVIDYIPTYKNFLYDLCSSYPEVGWGGMFKKWLFDPETPKEPYNSWGNGSAMRVSPVAHAFDDLKLVLEHAKFSAEITHNHPEGIKGAQAVAHCIFLALNGATKDDIREAVRDNYYPLSKNLDDIRPTYTFQVSCQGSVPIAILAFLESSDFESAIRLAISMGGDTDTIAAMAGSIAQAYYQYIPKWIVTETLDRLDYRLIQILNVFSEIFPSSRVDI